MKMVSTSSQSAELRATACHEAAHAIVAIRLGAAINEVTIRPSLARGGADGYCQVSKMTAPYAFAVIAAAGEHASRQFVGFDEAMRGGLVDRYDIETAISKYFYEQFGSAPTRRDMVDANIRVVARAKALVEDNWPLIERVATELLARETITGDDIRKIIEEADGTASRTLSVATRRLPDALPLQTRLQPIGAGAIDVETRTVTLTFTTGATVRRRRYAGWDSAVPFDEILLVSREAIDLTRLNAGAPVLDSHAVYSTSAQVAVVERAWIEGKEGRATVRFPKAGIDTAADRMFGLVADRVIRNISCGYRIDQVRIVEAAAKGVEQRIVEKWTPLEISFVTVGADPGAQVRSADGLATYPVLVNGASLRMPSGPAANVLARMRMRHALMSATGQA
ncbi:MAG: hypothetical protein E5Y73_14810 [Mesorhizobium sp.]|uniref:hypothetical protein n=1 Tax=Mesorhizobium sp. TaxID=1871066 RepID=UPI001221003F|nr:hypothetical protein [Mesorhizobium sp.]TIL93057.1 MAG: hypothetical protein E5Y73_14810 [Mesorhizobium sp.]